MYIIISFPGKCVLKHTFVNQHFVISQSGVITITLWQYASTACSVCKVKVKREAAYKGVFIPVVLSSLCKRLLT